MTSYSSDKPKVLVAGASGLVGGAAVEYFAGSRRWHVVAVSRRSPASPVPSVDYRTADLLDREACRSLFSAMHDVTHLVYAAISETPGALVAGWDDQAHVERNASMLDNLLDPLSRAARDLRHISLMQGTKAYAAHLYDQPARVPFKESQPRPDIPNFYFAQEDYVRERQASERWHWTILRPPMIAGGSGAGSNLNVLLSVAVFACLRKEAGLPLTYPGPTAEAGVNDMVDVELLARCMEWAATAPAARNRVFNIANGDVFTWPDLWQTIAEEIGLPAGEPQPLSLDQEIVARAQSWADIVKRYGLSAPADVKAFIGESAALADFAIQSRRSALVSTIALRQAGFHDCVDTAASIAKWLQRWRELRLLPPRS